MDNNFLFLLMPADALLLVFGATPRCLAMLMTDDGYGDQRTLKVVVSGEMLLADHGSHHSIKLSFKHSNANAVSFYALAASIYVGINKKF